ncbi:helix-turn-helix domain-containing protein [Actinokineospora terrae]|uniref:Helix-turn-helix domain-containing protein n=1 Tax=Actinokineospora terrae TaxID=155974 RepID=A0A1H9P9A0_9PSEU|nr:helix-turn-helix transcriptional regulator [Actinokineospora terrae]SER44750.1 Helix-turn-helix domain-containing protein [Actinokineospora terrae]
MRETTTGSTVPRRQLGRYLRDLRGRARLTVRAAAAELEWSETKIWRIETGQTPLRSLDTEAMCKIYGAPDDVMEYLKELSKKTKEQGWWHAYGEAVPDGFGLYIGLEEAVSSIDWYESDLIPGLFQTKEYSKEIIRSHHPNISEDVLQSRVALRTNRKNLLTRVTARPTISALLNEAILRRQIGEIDVMARQLDHLAELSQVDTVRVRVVPFAAGMHQGLVSGGFMVMHFPEFGTRESEPPVVHTEGLVGELFLDKPSEVGRYSAAFQDMWGKALDERDSLRFIHQTKKELRP